MSHSPWLRLTKNLISPCYGTLDFFPRLEIALVNQYISFLWILMACGATGSFIAAMFLHPMNPFTPLRKVNLFK